MNTKEFVHWMRGFVTACPKFHPTPEQWDCLLETLQKVNIEEQLQHIDAKGKTYPTYPEKPQIWYSNTTGTPPDFLMGHPSVVDNQVDKLLKG